MERGRTTVELAIRSGVVAGGLRLGALKHPEAARGLTRAADFHSQKASTYLAEICSGADFAGQAPAAMPTREA